MNIDEMTAQDVFDKVYRGLASQGFERSTSTELPGRSNTDACAYRGSHGRRCAVGWLIPDDLYDKRLENRGYRWLMAALPNGSLSWMPDGLTTFFRGTAPHKSLIDELQNVHDGSEEPEGMKAWLESIAAEKGLEVPAV
ncbi:MAG: hypothetical protein V6Z86_05610 [Hyphomicrobiales bacterium]